MPSLLDKVKNKLGLKKPPPGHKLGGGDYTCQQQQQQSSQGKPKLHRELSDQEKEARRDAMAAAAANRGQAWDKKVTKGAQTRRQEEKKKKQDQELNGFRKEGDVFQVQSEETLRMVEEAKRSEQKLAEVRTAVNIIFIRVYALVKFVNAMVADMKEYTIIYVFLLLSLK